LSGSCRGAGALSPHIVIGPIVWEAANRKRRWYFTIATAEAGVANFDQIGSDELKLTEAARASLLLPLVQSPPVVIHDCDDEVEMARLCEALWPSVKTQKLRLAVEAERGATHSARVAERPQ
jgi:hypothetical protein